MFCYQCEQTAHNTGCTIVGICGKTPEVAMLQDVLLDLTKGIAMYAHPAGRLGVRDPVVDTFVLDALFTTVTNVNFDAARLNAMLDEAVTVRKRAHTLYQAAADAAGENIDPPTGAATRTLATDRAGRLAHAEAVSIPQRTETQGEDITGLQELLLYGIKGAAAYASHARTLGREDPAVYAFIHEALDMIARSTATIDDLLSANLRCGEIGLRVLDMLDGANTGGYGQPSPTQTLMGHVPGKAILVSGHDLADLDALLEQTRGTGINVYTHGEMLPAHGYPALHKHPHLVGHFGGAWMRQRSEFDDFPGAILMTTNCIQSPAPTYQDRLFTCGLVAWPDVTHIADRDFRPVIEAALAAPGFTTASEPRYHTTGFGHQAVLSVAEPIVNAVKNGDIGRFVLIGGCDGAEQGRNYYTELAERLPDDTVILTLGCGKFRVVGLDLGEVAGLPRLLDMGQCNDAFSAIKVAQALATAFGVGVNDLPLSLVISWYEQKAVLVLLTLLHLRIRNITLGPRLPAFLSPTVLQVLVDTFGIRPTGDVDADMKDMLAA
jgi:hydroxylamine reductase